MIVTRVKHWDAGCLSVRNEDLAEEEPLEIRVNGHAISVTMRTPGHDAELAAGFLLTEGIIHSAEDILREHHCMKSRNVLHVTLSRSVEVDFEHLTRHVFASSSCGVCGKATIDSVHAHFPVLAANEFKVRPEEIAAMPKVMREHQETFERTGGIHAAAIFDASGKMIVIREDVGRHNAVDKAVGYCFLNKALPLDKHMLLVSGRTSFEIVQKALAARLPVIASVSAPSSLAAQFAEANGQTLIGFLRDQRMNVYTHAERIGSEASEVLVTADAN